MSRDSNPTTLTTRRSRRREPRYVEQINTTPLLSHGKYDVSRALETPRVEVQVNPTLPKELPEAA